MNIKVYRFSSDTQSTLSAVHIDGKFICYGLEDEKRTVKVWGETRIDQGKYNVSLRKVGGHHSRYSEKFKSFHKGMLHVENVPNFEYILIHIGNTDDDTAGCLLLGQECNNNRLNKGFLIGSTSAYREFYNVVVDSAESGELTIEYVDL